MATIKLHFSTRFISTLVLPIVLVALLVRPAVTLGREPVQPAFEQWRAACERLPSNRRQAGRLPPREVLPLQTTVEFDHVLRSFLEWSTNGPLAHPTNWVGPFPDEGFFNADAAYFAKFPGQPVLPYQPFAQTLNLEPDSQVYLRGDLHGDIHSLIANLVWLNENAYLSGFEITRPGFYMIFLGDFTDRGVYGVEVIYTLLRLKMANPARVFLLRGNHEELSLQARYGFLHEATGKYGNQFDARQVIRAYDFLPVVLYLGCGANAVQCNHGGMEPGFNPQKLLEAEGARRFQLLGALNQRSFFEQHPDWLRDAASKKLASQVLTNFVPRDPNSPMVLGFVWNDFTVTGNEADFAYDPARAFVYGTRATRFLLDRSSSPARSVQAVFRGHQHSSVPNPMMRRLVASGGVFQHWQAPDGPGLLEAAVTELKGKLEQGATRNIPKGSVWTFNVGPDSAYGQGCNYSFDAFGLVTLAADFENWKMQIVSVPVPVGK